MKGEKAEEIKEKLSDSDLKLDSEAIVYPLSPRNSNHEIICRNNYVHESPDLHTRSRCSEMSATIDPSSDVNCSKMDHLPEIKAINSKLEDYMQNVNSKFDALSEEISTIKHKKENKAYAILVLEQIITHLRKEKQEVNRENDELREKNRNLFHSLSEAREKVFELQD